MIKIDKFVIKQKKVWIGKEIMRGCYLMN